MPRQPRFDIPDTLHHVIVRGIDKCTISADDDDKWRFVSRLSYLLTDRSTKCIAWALMSNHFHLLLMPTKASLSELMRRLLTVYAVYFNRKYGRAGHLFQTRYKSILCEEEPHYLELVRYIHLNPLRAGKVSNLTELDPYPLERSCCTNRKSRHGGPSYHLSPGPFWQGKSPFHPHLSGIYS